MDRNFLYKRVIFVLCLVLGLRLLESGVLTPLILTLQTGRLPVEESAPEEENYIDPTKTTQHSEGTGPTDAVISFPLDELAVPAMRYDCDYRPDLEALLGREQTFGEEVTVLILHTHATEGYRGTEGYRSLESSKNMIAMGAELARVLRLGGIRVIHDQTLHDHPDYNTAYAAARKTIQTHLEEDPSIDLVLDLHRDASAAGSPPLTTSATVGGQEAAQIMLVVGTDAGGNYHPDWEKNLALALKLTAILEWQEPGVTRPVNLRAQRFNMDLTPGSLLVEVGAAGDTREAALLAVNALARAILTLTGR